MAQMKYFLYLDETGSHGLTIVEKGFPVFLLCGVLVSESNYALLRENMNAVKNEFWGDKKVVFHSRDIRKYEKEFVKLFDPEIKHRFYECINNIVSDNDYTIIASAIKKDEYIDKFGSVSNEVYEHSLSFIIERTIFFLDGIKSSEKELKIIIEKRGTKEDKKLEEHFQQLLMCGTGNVTAQRLRKNGKKYGLKIYP
jgi:hypothetical protein